MNTTTTEKLPRYKVVKIFRVSGRRSVIKRNISDVEEARRIVRSYPNSNRSMVVYYSY
jgi:hypothetical protein